MATLIDLDTYVDARKVFMERGPEAGVARQLVEYIRLVARSTDFRCFGAGEGRVPPSVCELYVEGPTAQIEDVGTLEEHRGRGLARDLVLAAAESARASGCDLVFLVADADDWPRALYEKLGFDAIGFSYAFLLTNSQ